MIAVKNAISYLDPDPKVNFMITIIHATHTQKMPIMYIVTLISDGQRRSRHLSATLLILHLQK